ncbi:Pterin-4-alpha-carbinolamine dehydratase [Thioalkalivibrio nitratireducens DSM 14787]|uniref:Putative pterin-4-alpha-carbinolamine dehydratase n=1 Tax=Thioalkalivibrio nitratireducens (strain DSM 14787 / UNIQEM 213 / ALEN2) TaxID=1255043 RepID=L0DU36_THIND|nr:4a-hydroxytetrahydrobiopterin dehydratase [Thioalkalivibrio nitratireducens]AGA32505.1 Pterin-4-alpha-carbinolamine dehydratase [Thioalkalivibrio nitratireducens DSM 14787]
MSDLKNRHCEPPERFPGPMSPADRDAMLKQLHPEWNLDSDQGPISRRLRFGNFHETVGFVNAVAWIANREDHHPDLEVSYNQCVVRFTTHAVNGLTLNDFVCAARIDALLE